ncbi:MAG: ornithine cyclodeaminase family protein, partial [Gemmatimonadetes bacterium]|nr:ornithine cyclodeaminase family protein [Gemmatimonadota bacterium]
MSSAPPPVVLDAARVQALLARLDPVAEMRRLFAALGRGDAVQPPQQLVVFPGGRGDSITYSGVLAAEHVFGVKVSPYIVRPGGGHVTAWTLLLGTDTGDPLLLCDARALTVARTAATTALAVDLLA